MLSTLPIEAKTELLQRPKPGFGDSGVPGKHYAQTGGGYMDGFSES